MTIVLPSTHTNHPQTIWLQKRSERYVIALLQEPQIRSIAWELDCPRCIQYLVTPYIVFVTGMSANQQGGTFLYYVKSKPRRLEDQLYHGNLPNTWVNDRVCMGDEDFMKALLEQHKSLSMPRERAFKIIESFWNGSFNNHLLDNFFALGRLDGRYHTVEDWAALSRREPEAVLTSQWRPTCTLGEAIERCWQSFGR